MYTRQRTILRVFYQQGGVRWYRVAKGRDLRKLVNYFTNLRHFHYAKLYAYGNGVEHELGAFGINYRHGNIYKLGIFDF